MILKEKIQEELDEMPEQLLSEVADFIGYLRTKHLNQRLFDITMASEEILSKDGMKDEEDDAWDDL